MEDQSEYDEYEDIEQYYPLAFLRCEGCEILAKAWRELNFEMKTAAHSRLLAEREAVKRIDCADYSELGRWGFLMSRPRRIAAATIAKTHRLTGVPLDAEREMFIDWFEMILLLCLTIPKVLAWVYACTHLIRALEDPGVRENNLTVAFLEKALTEAISAYITLDESELFKGIKSEAAQSAISAHAARNASRRTLEAREWARKEWANRTNIAMTKTQFGKDYALLVQHKFPEMELIKPSTITRDWLKGL